jgi:hypothetical protein
MIICPKSSIKPLSLIFNLEGKFLEKNENAGLYIRSKMEKYFADLGFKTLACGWILEYTNNPKRRLNKIVVLIITIIYLKSQVELLVEGAEGLCPHCLNYLNYLPQLKMIPT